MYGLAHLLQLMCSDILQWKSIYIFFYKCYRYSTNHQTKTNHLCAMFHQIRDEEGKKIYSLKFY